MSALVAPAPPAGLRAGHRPTFSVIIPAYQVAHLIAETVESVLAQTFPPVEVIVCDDGSTDDLSGALEPYRDRIQLLRKRNGGPASARNAALREASGDMVAILDGDDLFLPRRLEALAETAAARPDLDILTTDAYVEYGGRVVGRLYRSKSAFAVEDQRSAIVGANFIFVQAAVRRGPLLEAGFDEGLREDDDWDCWIRLILSGARAGLVYELLSVYRLQPSSLSSRRLSVLRAHRDVLVKTARHPGLRASERRAVNLSLRARLSELRIAEARLALENREPDCRERARDLARDAEVGVGTRLMALAALIAPTLAGRYLQRRAGGLSDWRLADIRLFPEAARDYELARERGATVP